MASVIMFHSVGLRRFAWRSPQIAEDVHYFRSKLRALAEAGYESVFFTDPRAWAPARAGDKVVCLTFDDGYLDNWVHVFPVLEELGFRASIFVTTDFIDPRDVLRPRARADFRDDANHDPASCCAGFLSWAEMRAMERSGLVEIQSHARTHDFCFSGPRIVDFWRPGAATRAGGPGWMLWNAFPDQKPFYLTRAAGLETQIDYGTPIYEHAKALEAPRWFPDDEALRIELASLVRERGGAAFFGQPGWKSELLARSQQLRGERPGGEYETREAYRQRVHDELAGSREALESGLGHEVSALVWPGGGVTPEVLEIAREVGYRVFTQPSTLDLPQAGSVCLVRRFPSICRGHWRGLDLGNLSAREFRWYLRACEGSVAGKLGIGLAKYVRVAAARTGVLVR